MTLRELKWSSGRKKTSVTYHDIWANKTVEEFLREFETALPSDVGKTFGLLPSAVKQLMAVMAESHTEKLAESFGLEACTILEAEEDIIGFDAFTLAICPMMIGYFATQFLYTHSLTPIEVDKYVLAARFLENDGPIEDVLPSHIDSILSSVLKRFLMPMLKRKGPLKDLLVRNKIKPKELDLFFTIEVVSGSAIWQTVNSIRRAIDPVSLIRGRVFLSYSSVDRRRVRLMERHLREHGLETWRDEKDLLAGAPLLDSIRDGIMNDSDMVVVFMSESSVQSQWVDVEIRIAYQREIQTKRTILIPVLLSDCAIPAELRVKRYIDARVGAREPAERIAAAVKGAIYRRQTRNAQEILSAEDRP